MTQEIIDKMVEQAESELTDVRAVLECVSPGSDQETQMLYLEAILDYKVGALYRIRGDDNE